MSAHERNQRSDEIEPGSDRAFGLVVGGILLAIAGYQLFIGSSLYLWTMVPGGALVVFGLVVPRALHPLNIAWMRLGLLLGKIVTPVVMFLVYVVSVVPIGVLLRLSGKDLLRLKLNPDEPSYWIKRDPVGPPPESLKDQF